MSFVPYQGGVRCYNVNFARTASSIAVSRSATLVNTPRRMRWRVILAKSRSMRLSHDDDDVMLCLSWGPPPSGVRHGSLSRFGRSVLRCRCPRALRRPARRDVQPSKARTMLRMRAKASPLASCWSLPMAAGPNRLPPPYQRGHRSSNE
jgi:hypothetical protein